MMDDEAYIDFVNACTAPAFKGLSIHFQLPAEPLVQRMNGY